MPIKRKQKKTRVHNKEYGQCAICHYYMKNEMQNKNLDCGHAFHQKCVWKWLVQRDTCPMCRKQVNTYPSYGCNYNEYYFYVLALTEKLQEETLFATQSSD